MVKLSVFILLSLSFVFKHDTINAQLLDSITLTTVKEYTSIEEAMQKPDEVYKLNLKKDKLKEFPKEIYQFKYLQVLNLAKNKLTSIPSDINNLKFLQDLDLSKNMLDSLPAELFDLKYIRSLKIGRNELHSLPPEIGNLSELRYLDLWSNNLTGLPVEISKLKKLREIDMRVIQFSEAKQDAMKALLPNTIIRFSHSCNCD